MLNTVFFNGSYTNLDQFYVHGTDLGLQRGYGIFDFMKLINRQNPWIDWYMDRLHNSMRIAGLSLPYNETQLIEIIDDLLTANQVKNAYIKIVVTAGYSEDGYSMTSKNNVFIFAMPIPAKGSGSIHQGMLISDEYRRDIPTIKSTNYMRSCMLHPKIKAARAVDVLYHWDGYVSEASRCNIFVVKDNAVRTPDKHILKGVTRRRVLNIQDPNISVSESSIRIEDVFNADEIFITSSTKGIMPIVAIDGKSIGDGQPGVITQSLMQHINIF